MLTPNDRVQLLDQGWLVVPNVVSKAHCEAVIDALCRFIEVDPNDPTTWQKYLKQGHGIIPLHHAQALWDVRQLPQLHAIFSAIYGTERLWVTLDRGSFKVPRQLHEAGFEMNPVHWDSDPRRHHDLAVQGLVYLTDTPPEQGAFAMVPALYRKLDDWLATPRSDAEIRRPDVTDYPLVPVGGAQGSLVIWHRRMPHTSLPNDTDRPRLVQYVTMDPARDDDARREFARLTLEKRPPAWALRQNVPGQLDPEPGPPVQLSALGRKLAGVDPW
jgi:hypothetical protein